MGLTTMLSLIKIEMDDPFLTLIRVSPSSPSGSLNFFLIKSQILLLLVHQIWTMHETVAPQII